MMKDSIANEEKESFLNRYGLRTVLQSTIYCWMTSNLGFSYCDRKKHTMLMGMNGKMLFCIKTSFVSNI